MISLARSALILVALMPAHAQAQAGFALSPDERRTIAKNMGATVKDVLEFESQCAKGFKHSCGVLEQYKSKTASRVRAEDLSRARQACAAGEQASCDAVDFGRDLEARQREGAARARKELIERYSAACAAGDQRACKNLSRLR
jgi:hypothetical protein